MALALVCREGVRGAGLLGAALPPCMGSWPLGSLTAWPGWQAPQLPAISSGPCPLPSAQLDQGPGTSCSIRSWISPTPSLANPAVLVPQLPHPHHRFLACPAWTFCPWLALTSTRECLLVYPCHSPLSSPCGVDWKPPGSWAGPLIPLGVPRLPKMGSAGPSSCPQWPLTGLSDRRWEPAVAFLECLSPITLRGLLHHVPQPPSTLCSAWGGGRDPSQASAPAACHANEMLMRGPGLPQRDRGAAWPDPVPAQILGTSSVGEGAGSGA